MQKECAVSVHSPRCHLLSLFDFVMFQNMARCTIMAELYNTSIIEIESTISVSRNFRI